jgi:hypothetical protein
MTFEERSASLPPFALSTTGYFCPFLLTSTLTSCHEWNIVAPFTASRRSSASRSSSIFSLIAASTTMFFRSPRRLQTGTRASKRPARTLVASIRIFTESPSSTNGIKLGKTKGGGYSKFRYLQFNNFAISTLFRA